MRLVVRERSGILRSADDRLAENVVAMTTTAHRLSYSFILLRTKRRKCFAMVSPTGQLVKGE